MQIMINEEKMLEKYIEQGYLDNNLGLNYFITLAIRFYKKYHSQYTNTELISSVLKLCLTMNLNKQEFILYELIQKILSKENKYNNTIRDYDSVPLYEAELNLIKSLENQREQKIVFTCIIIARLTGKNGWINLKLSELFKLANTSMKNEDMQKFMYILEKKKIIYEPINNKKSSLHIDLIPQGNIVLNITEIKNLGNYILAYLRPNYFQCKECGKLVKIKNKHDGSSKYCTKCADKIRNEKRIDYNYNYYHKEVDN